jgi:hypothetical protein
MNEELEVWKWVKFEDVDGNAFDYSGAYKVSNFGRVKSFKHNKTVGRIRAFSIDKDGYSKVDLWRNSKQKMITVHRLVACAFVEYIDGNNIVNHKDEDKSNNHYDNLEWVTTRDNIRYSKENGTGISFVESNDNFCLSLGIDGKKYHIGFFDTFEDAEIASADVLENGIEQRNKYSKRRTKTEPGSVSFCKKRQKWQASASIDKKKISIGRFNTEVLAWDAVRDILKNGIDVIYKYRRVDDRKNTNKELPGA